MNARTLSIESLNLDLRGLPRETAEAVPGHLGKALQNLMADKNPDHFSSQQAPLDLNMKIDRNESASSVAHQIASKIVDSFQAPTL